MDPRWIPHYVGSVRRASLVDAQLRNLFCSTALIVPVPGSSVSLSAPWPAAILAVALQRIGLGSRVWIGLRRRIAVRKSATALAGQRPTVGEHYASFCVAPGRLDVRHVVLVDDVITKGRTMLAAASRLQADYPHADIRGFALIRTLGRTHRLERVFDPCHGFVRWSGEDARRDP